jgi:hypothetical protein
VDDIPPFGPPDPPALDMTNISDRTRGAANCLKSAMGIPGDGELFESGYRTLEYQKHFRDLWKKKIELEDALKTNPSCAQKLADVTAHFNRHGLGASKQIPSLDAPDCQQTGTCNCHTAGTCFDIKTRYTADIDFNSEACGVYRPWPALVPPGPRDDPGHVILLILQ